jgi:phosphoglycerate dehydrogenase-like enzyme
MPKAKVVIFAAADTESHEHFRRADCELIIGRANWADPTGDPEDKLVEMAAHADALLGTSIKGSRISRQVMMASENLRIVGKYTVGVDEVDVRAATELGIVVTHAPTEANWGGVAESTVTVMLAMLKKVRERDAYVKAGRGWRHDSLLGTYVGPRQDGYQGITLGIVGLGRVGGRYAKLMRPWEMRMIGYDPYVPASRFAELGVEQVDYDTLLREADVVSFHVTLTDETRHMVGARELGLMKPTAILINNARGPVIDEPALIEALQHERIAGAALDVLEKEPVDPKNPLLKMDDRVLLTPHMAAGNHGAGLGPGIVWGTQDVLRALRGQEPEHVFNPEVLPRWRERFAGRAVI